MRVLGLSSPDLERWLLRKGVSAMREGCDRCASCTRTPLLGERVHVDAKGRHVCELCRARDGAVPVSSFVVHGSERGHAVRGLRPLAPPAFGA